MARPKTRWKRLITQPYGTMNPILSEVYSGNPNIGCRMVRMSVVFEIRFTWSGAEVFLMSR